MTRHDERGQITAFVAALAVSFVTMAGGIWDGARVVNARLRAWAEADGAARAGAQAVSIDALRATKKKVVLDPEAAAAKARLFLAKFGDDAGAQVTVVGDRVEVTVRVVQPLDILRPLSPITASGTGTARPRVGVTEAEP